MINSVRSGLTLVDLPPESIGLFGDVRGDWHVLHTRSRQEKALAQDLAARGVRHFLPIVRHERFYGDRKAFVDLPLFPGYVFVRGDLEEVFLADRTRRVANILKVANQRRIDWELCNLYLALSAKAPLLAYSYLKHGAKAEVKAGPYRGLQGIIESRPETGRLLLQVEMLGQAVALNVGPANLMLVD